MIVKIVPQSETTATKYYEFYEEEEAKDMNGNVVTIAKSIGKVSLVQLEEQVSQLTAQLEEVNSKITLIDELIAK